MLVVVVSQPLVVASFLLNFLFVWQSRRPLHHQPNQTQQQQQHRTRAIISMTSASSTSSSIPSPKEGIDFEALPWNLNLPNEHFYLHLTTDKEWPAEGSDDEAALLHTLEQQHFYPFGQRPLPSMTPATTSLNYATTIWEGLKAYRTPPGAPLLGDNNDEDEDDGGVVVFRADANYERMQHGATEMCLPMPSRNLFLRAIQCTIQKNAHLLPPAHGVGMKLYLRPLLMGSGQQLGLYPSPQFSFLVFCSPTGNYFKAATT
jgi:branched-chain amino acid aminotransferase